MRLFSVAVVVAACALLTTGCFGGTPEATPSAPAAAPSEAPSAASTPPSEAVTVTSDIGTHEVEFMVGPLVNEGELSILPIEARSLSNQGDEPLDLKSLWGLSPTDNGIRLLDAEQRTVEEVAVRPDATNETYLRPVYSKDPFSLEDQEATATLYAVFGANEAEAVDVLVPFAGLAIDVPVVDIDDLRAEQSGAARADVLSTAFAELVSDDDNVLTQRAELESFTASIDGAVDTSVSQEQVLVNIDTSVLFKGDEAEITPAADKTLVSATTQFSSYTSGALQIIGHTSTGGDESPAYNDDLSKRRAHAAFDRLKTLVDLSAYDASVDGRGLTEPRVEGDTEEARSLNRRVELVFTPDAEADDTVAEAPEYEVPASDGPTAEGAEGVNLVRTDGSEVHVSLDSIQQRGSVLIGQVRIEHVSGDISPLGMWFSRPGVYTARGNPLAYNLHYAADDLTLISGDQRVYPLDYARPDTDPTKRLPLTELYIGGSLPDDSVYTTTIVWPGVFSSGTGSTPHAAILDSWTSNERLHGDYPPFRLTDIPVTQ